MLNLAHASSTHAFCQTDATSCIMAVSGLVLPCRGYSKANPVDATKMKPVTSRLHIAPRGIAGEIRLDGGQATQFGSRETSGNRLGRVLRDGVAMYEWGLGTSCRSLRWSIDHAAGVTVFADATIHDPARLAERIGCGHVPADVAELLLQAYLRWGGGLLDQIEGDFAFVIVDERNGVIFAACDPMGMRSLFYRLVPGKVFWFSTDQSMLGGLTGLDPRLPESRLLEPVLGIDDLAYCHPVIEGVERLQAAHLLRIDGGRSSLSRYWTPYARPPVVAPDDEDGWIEGLRWHLRDAVRKRVADGEQFGVMFSGGLDSSSVLALACSESGAGRIAAYSLVDRGNLACRETRAIDSVVAATGVPAVQIDLANMQAHVELALESAAHAAQVVDGRAGFIMLLTRMAMDAGVKVMSNGLDSDALFSFHDWLRRLISAGQYDVALSEARALDQVLGSHAWYETQVRRMRVAAVVPDGWLKPIRSIRTYRGFGKVLSSVPLRRDVIHRFQLRQRLHERARVAGEMQVAARELPPSSMGSLSVVESAWRVGVRSTQLGGYMSCPFFDRTLIEFATWIPLGLRLRGGMHKWVLRKAMESSLPADVAWRCDKPHFNLQFDQLMLRPVLERMERAFRGSGPAMAAYIDRARFLKDAEAWRHGDLLAVERLQMILLLENWLGANSDRVAFGS